LLRPSRMAASVMVVRSGDAGVQTGFSRPCPGFDSR
jgi:hypothetical protein